MGTGKCDCGGRFELGVLPPCTRSLATLPRPPVCAFARLDATCLDAGLPDRLLHEKYVTAPNRPCCSVVCLLVAAGRAEHFLVMAEDPHNRQMR